MYGEQRRLYEADVVGTILFMFWLIWYIKNDIIFRIIIRTWVAKAEEMEEQVIFIIFNGWRINGGLQEWKSINLRIYNPGT